MKSSNPHSGCRQVEISKTLDSTDPNPNKNQGGIAILQPIISGAIQPNEVICCIDGDKIGKAERSGGSGLGIRDGDKMYTLTAKDAGTHSVAFQTYQKVTGPLMANSHPGSYCGQDAHSDMLVAGVDCRNMNEVCIRYIVRRLTPTECARLQGFADAWAVPDSKGDFTDDEYRFWCEVYLTKALIDGTVVENEDGDLYFKTRMKPYKHKTKAQMLNWYNKLRTDGSEYKLWGNGIALPTALYVMQGIADVLNQ